MCGEHIFTPNLEGVIFLIPVIISFMVWTRFRSMYFDLFILALFLCHRHGVIEDDPQLVSCGVSVADSLMHLMDLSLFSIF